MQGFAFDNVNRRLFVAQLRNGTSGDDLCVNQLSFAGELVGAMHLDGAGHGDPAAIDSYLTCIDMNTGGVVARALTKAGQSLVYREPERHGGVPHRRRRDPAVLRLRLAHQH
jgi:hypothetical protein